MVSNSIFNFTGKNLMKDFTLQEILTFIPSSYLVLGKYGVDYFRKPGRSLVGVCKEFQLSPDKLWFEIDQLNKKDELNFYDLEVPQLISVIRNRFHSLEKVTMGYLVTLVDAFKAEHPGMSSAELLDEELRHLKTELDKHAMHEENFLFPYIVKLNEAVEDQSAVHVNRLFHTDMSLYEEEHDDTMIQVEKVAKLLNIASDLLPDDTKLQDINELFDQFIVDLQLHLHLENNILFPKARDIEHRLKTVYKVLG
jgi:regulator of cell morphogenesis and NO signaling